MDRTAVGSSSRPSSSSSSSSSSSTSTSSSTSSSSSQKSYDYLLKFLLVGDSDVGKHEILSDLDDGSLESPFCGSSGVAYKTTTILLDGKRIRLQLWDTSGQGRFSTIIRSYSRGAQGIILVYDITNKWSFDGIDRWLHEVEEHAPGIPKILIGNRLHLAFKRQVTELAAELYARKNSMAFFEVSPLCDYNITESFAELSRMALHRNGMERLWRNNRVLSLKELCCRAIVARTTVYSIEQLPLPPILKSCLKSYSMTSYQLRPRLPTSPHDKSLSKKASKHHNHGHHHHHHHSHHHHHHRGGVSSCESLPFQCRKSCTIS